MDEISVRGKKYLKAKLVARELGYTTDYIGQLCRAEKVDAELVGRTWYVNPDSVKGHKGARYRSTKAATKRELRADLVRSLQQQQQTTEREHFYAHRARPHEVASNYETDEAELFPQVNKNSSAQKLRQPVELEVALADAEEVPVKNQTEKTYHFTAPKKEETKFYGTLEVKRVQTEVQVTGVNVTKSVPVHGRFSPAKPKTKSVQKPELENQKLPELAPERAPIDSVATPGAVRMPVQVEGEVVAVPIVYHFVTVCMFVLGLLFAASTLALEVRVVYEQGATMLTTQYALEADNLSALIYLVK